LGPALLTLRRLHESFVVLFSPIAPAARVFLPPAVLRGRAMPAQPRDSAGRRGGGE